jgi:hypothetical protein
MSSQGFAVITLPPDRELNGNRPKGIARIWPGAGGAGTVGAVVLELGNVRQYQPKRRPGLKVLDHGGLGFSEIAKKIAAAHALDSSLSRATRSYGSSALCGSDAVMRVRKNAWTVGVAGGQLSGTYMTFANEMAQVLDDGDNLRVLLKSASCDRSQTAH